MILTIHILIGVSSILVGIFALMRVSKSSLLSTLVLGSLTAISGALLAVMNPNHLTHVCISGTITLACIGTLAYVASRRLTAITVSSRD